MKLFTCRYVRDGSPVPSPTQIGLFSVDYHHTIPSVVMMFHFGKVFPTYMRILVYPPSIYREKHCNEREQSSNHMDSWFCTNDGYKTLVFSGAVEP